MANQHKNSLAHVHLPVIELRLRAHNPVEDRGKYSQSGSVCYHLLRRLLCKLALAFRFGH
jgi:hypothetical protein